jgi:hypothetical protein
MNIFINVLIAIAFIIIGINIYHIDFSNFFSENNKVPVIGIFASICAILFLLILKKSKELVAKLNQN